MAKEKKMAYDALSPILYGRDQVMTREYFGTSLPKQYDAGIVDSIATRMISKCKTWITNWETVQEAIAPEVEEIRLKQVENRLSQLSPQEMDAYLEYLQKKRAEIAKLNN